MYRFILWFAYAGQTVFLDQSARNLAPLSPWKAVAEIPAPIEEHANWWNESSIIRNYKNSTELWFERWILDSSGYRNLLDYQVYKPDTSVWETIPITIDDEVSFARYLYVQDDGTIFSLGMPKFKDTATLKISVGKFNENSKRFEFYDEIVIPWGSSTRYIQDNFGNLWIFAPGNKISSYSFQTKNIQEYQEIPEMTSYEVVFGRENLFYILGRGTSTNIQKSLYIFDSEENEITEVAIPTYDWVLRENLFVDHLRNLWVGSIGNRQPNGDWLLFHPNLDRLEADIDLHIADSVWYPANIIAESSNGYLWFSREGANYDGFAWFDPQNGTGCWFTTANGALLESPPNEMWLALDQDHLLYYLELP